jgi:LysR family nitrogen assimilation transcriptional regulator
MNDRQLRYAHAVWKERSFSRAAGKLRVSQPSLSDQVRLLEEELGFALFYRNARGVESSVKGRTFLEAAGQIVQGMTSLSDLASELRGKPGPRIRVGLHSGLAQSMVPRLTHVLSGVGHRVHLEVITATNRRIQRLLHQERLDFAFLFEGEVKGSGDKLSWEKVAQSEVVVLLPNKHPLAKRRDGVELSDVGRGPLIVNEPSVGYGLIIQELLTERNLTPDIVADCDDIESVKYMVLSGAGMALVPRIVARDEVVRGLMSAVPIKPGQAVAIHAIHRPNSLSPRLEQYLKQLIQEFGKK